MAFHVRHPFLTEADRPDAWTFSGLFLLESIARASLVTVLPLTVYAAFRDKQTVSLVYTCVSLAALGVSFAIPTLVRTLSRRWTYTLGACLIGLCATLVGFGAGWSLPLALLARTSGAAMLNVTLSLYILDNIARQDLVRSEPLRLGVATLAWSACPFAGVWLMQRAGVAAPALLSLAAVATLLAAFWTLRLREGGPIRPGPSRIPPRPRHPIAAVRRFAAQPRLRLAWTIAFARSAFWVTFFIYIPILMVEGGLGPTAGGLAVAAGNLMLLNNLVLRRLGGRLSVRRVIGVAFLAAGALTLVSGLASLASPAAAGAAMVAGAFFVAMLDGLGPIPYLRAVRAHEREAMTTVYRTYLDASELLPPLAYFFLLQVAGFAGAFAGLAVLLAAVGILSLRHLPRGL
ncbi:MFS transporter [Amaricoccus sp.]|uniref:MFS transporter n=1 Tax=Amaricoccus sp. TaxID=1872485 RepID=UPI001B49D011|nr:MFS transporter [Amaricoccus sp.]MBP7002448.1 MFS transporter [Amaricoccus sp.]